MYYWILSSFIIALAMLVWAGRPPRPAWPLGQGQSPDLTWSSRPAWRAFWVM